jgi:hypothetical protein
MQLFRRTSQLLALALAAASLSSSASAQKPLQMHEEDFDAIRGLAEYITSPSGIASVKAAREQGVSGDDVALALGAAGEAAGHAGSRRLGATDEECGVFLAASLAPHLWECFEMAQTVLGLVKQQNCETSYDFSAANMQRICTNQCHSVLHKTLITMSEAGCSASALKQTCNECASGEKCVGTKCRQVCSPSLPCPCSYTCESGACIPPKNSEMTLNDMGVNGYRIALEYLCTTSPQTKNYCFSDIFGVLDKVDASTFCAKMRPVGCCTGTVFNFVTQCATANDTISTSVGASRVSRLACVPACVPASLVVERANWPPPFSSTQ